jgi:hypothetical protein
MHFTAHNNGKIDEKIQGDLDTIKKCLVEAFPGVRALILVGGFGRGEGSVLLDANKIRPINDYDIVVVSENVVDPVKLRREAKRVASTLGIWHVDLVCIPEREISTLPLTMFNYDAKYGGYVFWGNEKIFDSFPPMNASKLPLEEGRILLFNRIVTVLECFSVAFLHTEPPDRARLFLVAQTTKGILAACDAVLILERKYHHSYREKQNRFNALKRPNEQKALVDRAVSFKLFPTSLAQWDAVDYWFAGKAMFQSVFREFMTFLLGRDFLSWTAFVDYYRSTQRRREVLSQTKIAIKRMLGIGGSEPKSTLDQQRRLLNLQLAGLLLLFGLHKSEVDKELLDYLRSNLLPFQGTCGENTVGEWEELRRSIVQQLHALYGVDMPRELPY